MLVTGASRGIGKIVALRLGRDGADIAVCARTEIEGPIPGTIGETAAAIAAMGVRALPLRLDLSDDASMDLAVAATLAEFGRIDVLVNNAVIVGPRRPLVGGTPEFLDTAYRVNVRAPYKMAAKVSAAMATAGGGTIINITSESALHSAPPIAPASTEELGGLDPSYGMTKAALDRMTTAYASELLAHHIAIVSIAPGLVITERIAQAAIARHVDVSRAESPEIIAEAVARLALNAIPYTGRVFFAKDFLAELG